MPTPLQPSDGPAPFRCDYNVYSTFQSHEPEFDYLKSLEIEEKINKIRWLRKAGPALFLLTTNGEQQCSGVTLGLCFSHILLSGPLSVMCEWCLSVRHLSADKTIKLWKITERWRNFSGWNLVDSEGLPRDQASITQLRVPQRTSNDITIEAVPRRIFSNAHAYHINSISVNSDDCMYLSADDLRVYIWHLERTEQSFSIRLHLWCLSVCVFVGWSRG